MFTSVQRAVWFIIAVIVLAAALSVVAGQSRGRAEWQTWQQTYFARTGVPADIRVRQVVPQMTGEPELCITCHIGLAEISPSHPVDVFGCVICHGGNPLSLEADQAHEGLRGGKNPADLSAALLSCGQGCHDNAADIEQNHVARVQRSIQATYAGGIATVRFSFGAQSGDIPIFGVYGVTDNAVLSPNGLSELAAFPRQSDHPIDQKFAENCLDAGCHLTEPARAEPYFFRSTGCAACHVVYENDGFYRGNDPTIPRDEPGHMRLHQLTTAIPFYQCNHCHNRGNYSLRQMDFLLRPDLPPAGAELSAQMPAEGRRLIEYYQPIGQFTLCEWTLDCIDCHTTQEAMGDGDIHPNQAEMQYTQCQTCHGTLDELPAVATVTAENVTALRLASVNPNYDLQVGDTVIATERGELMGYAKLINGKYVLTGKVSGEEFPFYPVMGSGCQQDVEQQESHYCHACHAYAE